MNEHEMNREISMNNIHSWELIYIGG